MDNQPTRVSYREGQRLRADDLTAEQDYLVELERRHNLDQHAPGIVSGFAISGASIEGGIAVNEDGRVLTVEESADRPDETTRAWIVLCESCVGTRKDRRRELARVVSGEQPGALYVDAPSRRYTSLSASQADDPAGRAAMQVGPRGARDRNAFVIAARNPGGMLTPRIALEVQGNNRFIGDVIAAPYPRDAGELVPSVIIEGWVTQDPARDLSGLGFDAMSAAPPDPPMPGIYAIGAGTPAEPVEQLRIDLGKQVDGDLSTRFSAGARDTGLQPFREWLQINGKGDLVLSDVPDPANAPVSIEVSGTIERGPIKPDLADPKFTGLLKLAWLAGLRQSMQANAHVTVTVETPPPPAVETEQTWSFGVAVHQETGGPITVDAVTAILTHTDLDGVTTVQPITTSVNAVIAHEGTKSITVTHAGGFVSAGSFSIKAQVTGKIGTGAWWNELDVPGDITIIEKPVFEASLDPPDAQTNTPFDESVRIVNNAAIPLKILLVGFGTLIQGTGVVVLPGQDHTFTEQNLLLPLPVAVTYIWDGFTEVRTFTVTPVLEMEESVSMSLRAAGTDTEPLVFDVAFRNSTAGDLRVLSVSHRIVSGSAEPQESSTKQFKRTVKPGRRTTIGNLSVEPPAAPAADAKLEVEIEIESGGQRHIVKKEFDLT